MRGIDGLNVPTVVAVLFAVAFAAVAGELPELLATGGWFAVFGQMLAVVAAVAIVVVAGTLAVAVIALPLIAAWALARPLSEARERLKVELEVEGQVSLTRLMARALGPAWALAWRLWWRLRPARRP